MSKIYIFKWLLIPFLKYVQIAEIVVSSLSRESLFNVYLLIYILKIGLLRLCVGPNWNELESNWGKTFLLFQSHLHERN